VVFCIDYRDLLSTRFFRVIFPYLKAINSIFFRAIKESANRSRHVFYRQAGKKFCIGKRNNLIKKVHKHGFSWVGAILE